MLNAQRDQLIERYAAELRGELCARDLKPDLVDDTVKEAISHLQEAIDAANPQSAEEFQLVINRFGGQRALAKNLEAEELRLATRGRFLWPALVAPLAMWLLLHPIPQARLFNDGLYAGTFYMLLAGVALFLLGLRARRPLFGQFAALAVVLIFGQAAWYSATDIPVEHRIANGGLWIEPVGRADVSTFLASTSDRIDRFQDLQAKLLLGKRVFAAGEPPAKIPAEFTYHGLYWRPEGLREVSLPVRPEDIYPTLLAQSWSVAVFAWNGSTAAGQASQPSEADRILARLPDQIAFEKSGVTSLASNMSRPLASNAVTFMRMVTPWTFVLCGMAAAVTNAGWVVWLAWRGIARAQRRLKHGAAPLGAARQS